MWGLGFSFHFNHNNQSRHSSLHTSPTSTTNRSPLGHLKSSLVPSLPTELKLMIIEEALAGAPSQERQQTRQAIRRVSREWRESVDYWKQIELIGLEHVERLKTKFGLKRARVGTLDQVRSVSDRGHPAHRVLPPRRPSALGWWRDGGYDALVGEMVNLVRLEMRPCARSSLAAVKVRGVGGRVGRWVGGLGGWQGYVGGALLVSVARQSGVATSWIWLGLLSFRARYETVPAIALLSLSQAARLHLPSSSPAPHPVPPRLRRAHLPSPLVHNPRSSPYIPAPYLTSCIAATRS